MGRPRLNLVCAVFAISWRQVYGSQQALNSYESLPLLTDGILGLMFKRSGWCGRAGRWFVFGVHAVHNHKKEAFSLLVQKMDPKKPTSKYGHMSP